MEKFCKFKKKMWKVLKINSLGGQRWFENPLGGLTTSSPRVLAPMTATPFVALEMISDTKVQDYGLLASADNW